MTPPADPNRDKHHRFPGDILSPGVWLYERFPLRSRDVQELLLGAGATSPLKRSGKGVANSAKLMPINGGDGGLSLGTNGRLRRDFARATASVMTYGGLSIRPIPGSPCSCKAGATSRPRSRFAARSSRGGSTCRG
jgi:hypothetical protein